MALINLITDKQLYIPKLIGFCCSKKWQGGEQIILQTKK